MLINYLTLVKITEEIRELVGTKLIECFSQEKNVIIFTFFDGSNFKYVQFNSDTILGSLFLRKNFNRANKNSVDLFPELIGNYLKDICISETDRIITFDYGDVKALVRLFGGGNNNLFIYQTVSNIILEAFKKNSKFAGKNIDEIQFKSSDKNAIKNINLFDYISKNDISLGKYYTNEFLINNELDGQIMISALPLKLFESIHSEAMDYKHKILDSKEFYILKNGNGNQVFSLIKLHDFEEVVESFESVSQGVEKRIRKYFIAGHLNDARKESVNQLLKLNEKLSRKIEQINDNTSNFERADKYKKWAELLISQPNQKSKPGKSIKIENWENNLIEIPILPELNLNENAKKYFDKAQSAVLSFNIRMKFLPDLKEKLSRTTKAIFLLDNSKTTKEIEKIMDEYKDLLNTPENKQDEPASRFRVFDLGEGYILYVGKSAANNDELTVKFAKPNDLWFHARGSSGSHAVLRLNKEEKPPKFILQKAASIAAYYSGSKNAKYTPVCYTYKKYVHKPKGSNPGSVTISREEVIMVEPKLPDEKR